MRKRYTKIRLGEGLDQDQTDWKRLKALTDEEVARAIAEDPDTFELQPEWLEHAVIVMPARPKERITARIDKDVIAWFKEQGEGYQSRMNAVLRAYYEAQQFQKTTKTRAKTKEKPKTTTRQKQMREGTRAGLARAKIGRI